MKYVIKYSEVWSLPTAKKERTWAHPFGRMVEVPAKLVKTSRFLVFSDVKAETTPVFDDLFTARLWFRHNVRAPFLWDKYPQHPEIVEIPDDFDFGGITPYLMTREMVEREIELFSPRDAVDSVNAELENAYRYFARGRR